MKNYSNLLELYSSICNKENTRNLFKLNISIDLLSFSDEIKDKIEVFINEINEKHAVMSCNTSVFKKEYNINKEIDNNLNKIEELIKNEKLYNSKKIKKD